MTKTRPRERQTVLAQTDEIEETSEKIAMTEMMSPNENIDRRRVSAGEHRRADPQIVEQIDEGNAVALESEIQNVRGKRGYIETASARGGIGTGVAVAAETDTVREKVSRRLLPRREQTIYNLLLLFSLECSVGKRKNCIRNFTC